MQILFVAKLHSPHTARWISQITDLGWDIHVFGYDEKPHLALRNVTFHQVQLKKLWPFKRGEYRLRHIPYVRDILFPFAFRLATLIRELQPDCIHSLMFASEMLEAKRLLGGKLPGKWIYSSWGSDVFFEHQLPKKREFLKKVFASVDYYISDCQRDVGIARGCGFKGEVLGVFPRPGAYRLSEMLQYRSTAQPSQRKVITFKGYQNYSGRALTTLEAIRLAADSLKPYQIIIHSAIGTWASGRYEEVKAQADKVAQSEGLNISFMPHSPLEAMWELFGHSRVSIAISASDGTPNTMLESMVMGAFPIQSDTSAASEWIEDGVNGAIVPHDDPEAIARAIRRAAIDDALVDSAAEINLQLARERLDTSVIVPQVHAMYNRVFAEARKSK
jgi:glycosyltransferase involved in cell wall biosynthesis